ncbi:MAG: class I SAM-dependent methyltransferase [Clostridia bacterium]|nr:class I SAM-dependent methyltransferase [Clostridia bacterium]
MRGFELRSARFLASDCLQRYLKPGDTAVDATMGNGYDTLMLCELVGDEGHVYAFDVQQQALENTKKLLTESGCIGRAQLILDGHEHMCSYVSENTVDAVVFNLGWLPGSDKSVRTHWETTKQAVLQALEILKPGGICVICVYPGHDEGAEELAKLTEMLADLPPQRFNVLRQTFINASPGSPECFIAQKQ